MQTIGISAFPNIIVIESCDYIIAEAIRTLRMTNYTLDKRVEIKLAKKNTLCLSRQGVYSCKDDYRPRDNGVRICVLWWRRGESNPRPKAFPWELLRAQTVIYIPLLPRGLTHSEVQ